MNIYFILSIFMCLGIVICFALWMVNDQKRAYKRAAEYHYNIFGEERFRYPRQIIKEEFTSYENQRELRQEFNEYQQSKL